MRTDQITPLINSIPEASAFASSDDPEVDLQLHDIEIGHTESALILSASKLGSSLLIAVALAPLLKVAVAAWKEILGFCRKCLYISIT